MMKGLWLYVSLCAIVCGLYLAPVGVGRWLAISLAGIFYVVTAVLASSERRRIQPSNTRRLSRVRGDGSGF